MFARLLKLFGRQQQPRWPQVETVLERRRTALYQQALDPNWVPTTQEELDSVLLINRLTSPLNPRTPQK